MACRPGIIWIGIIIVLHCSVLIVAYKCSISVLYRVEKCKREHNDVPMPSTSGRPGIRNLLGPELMRVMPTIYLNNSNILDITEDAFDSVPELQKLFLNDNMIVELKPSWFMKLGNLLVLDLSRNQITTYIPGTLQRVRGLLRLFLASNEIEKFNGQYDNFTSTVIDLSHNPLIEFRSNAIHSLHANQTNLTRLFVDRAINIYAENNKLERFSIPNGVRDQLHLRGNNLKDINNFTAAFDQLQYLDLSQGFIGTVKADALINLRNLRHLNLSKTEMYEIYYGWLSNQNQLEVLDLSFNFLWHLNMNKMYPAQLRELHISGNAIWKITDSRKTIRSLEKVAVAGNELSCDRLFNLYFKGIDRGMEFYTPPHMLNYTSDNIAGMPCRNVL